MVCIPEELYKSLVISFRERIGVPVTDTTGLACPFCPKEFRTSNVLRHHYRMYHTNIETEDVELNTHKEGTQGFV